MRDTPAVDFYRSIDAQAAGGLSGVARLGREEAAHARPSPLPDVWALGDMGEEVNGPVKVRITTDDR
jgi:hypothetical protein